MARSILDTLALAATMTVVAPVALAGVLTLAEGEYFLGGAFLGLAVLALAIERYVTSPTDVPAEAAKRAVGAAVRDPDQGDSDDRE